MAVKPMKNKAAGVMSALKGRKNIASKKGKALFGIIAKLSEKREAAKGKKGGMGGCGKK